MGVVYLARDTTLDRPVALKALSPRFASDPVQRLRLEREACAAASLTHPSIATVFALEEFEGRLFLCSEYLEGTTLRDELAHGPLPGFLLLQTALGIARPLAAAHRAGIVHRDLKPENVMRTREGVLKILDFGLATAAHTDDAGPMRLTQQGAMLGTPAYMSPEQLRDGAIDTRSDQFAFGVLMYELATGFNPFASPTAAGAVARILEERPPALLERVPVQSTNAPGLGGLSQIVSRCLEKDAGARFASTDELVAALEALPASRHASPHRDLSRWWWQFHQAITNLAYVGLLVPLGYASGQLDGRAGDVLFLCGLVAALTAITLRLHLWFASRLYRDLWRVQREQTLRPARWADRAFAAALGITGVWIVPAHRPLGLTMAGAAAIVALVAEIIEPATERAAFHDADPSHPF
jgi:hypothetical protein